MEEYYFKYFKQIYPTLNKDKFLKCMKRIENQYAKYDELVVESNVKIKSGIIRKKKGYQPKMVLLIKLKQIYTEETGNHIIDLMIRTRGDADYKFTFIYKTNLMSSLDKLFKKKCGVLVQKFEDLNFKGKYKYFNELKSLDKKYLIDKFDPKKYETKSL